VGPGQSVSCSGDGQLDSSYSQDSTVDNSAGASSDQPPGDTTTTGSSSSTVVSVDLPTVQIDTPVPSAILSGKTTISGFAIDRLSAINQVQIWVDSNNVGNATMGGSRQDVCSTYSGWVGCPAGNVGFSFQLDTTGLSPGFHTIMAVAIDTDAIPDASSTTVPVTVAAGYSIGGKITLSGAGLSGVTVTLSGSQNATTTTDSSGNYSFSVLGGGSYTVTPSPVGYTFTPANLMFANVSGNQTANFTASNGGLEFYSVTPCRVADTRIGTGVFGGPSMSAGSPRQFPIPSGGCKIPATAAAFSLNFTVVPVVPPGYLGYLTTWPAGQPEPNVSTLNSYTGTVVANTAIVPAGTGGAISVDVHDATNVLFDINGYFAPPVTGGLQFFQVSPCRVADTRIGTGVFGGPSMGAGAQRSFPISSGGCNIPASATAYSLNFTVVPKGYLGFLTTWPAGQSEPNASTLNSYTGTVVSNAAIVPAGTGGAISVHVTDPTDVIMDINGYFAPPANSGLNFYPVTPCRVTDTRFAGGKTGEFGPPTMAANTQRSFRIPSSTCNIPVTAAAYSLNFTVVPAKGYLGYLTTWPAGQSMPGVSTLNSYDGRVVANAAIVPAGAGGAITIYVTDPTDVLFDINGYFAP
jgi:hypothetical protein